MLAAALLSAALALALTAVVLLEVASRRDARR